MVVARPTTALLFLMLTLYAWQPSVAVSRESLENEADDISSSTSSIGHAPRPVKEPLEAEDMMKDDEQATPETVAVDHPNVVDTGTTHEEGSHPQPRTNATGQINTCNLPPSIFRDDTEDDGSVVGDWLADTDNFANYCSIPKDWLHGNSSGDIHICSIPKEWWESNNGNITKELLAEINDTTISCVTPSQILSNSSSADNATASGTIPSAWLRDSDDNIYIYFIPRAWLKRRAQPEKKNDGVKEQVSTGPVTSPAPASKTTAVNITSSNTTNSSSTPLPSVSVEVTTVVHDDQNITEINSTVPAETYKTSTVSNSTTDAPAKSTTAVPVPPQSNVTKEEEKKEESAIKTTATPKTSTTQMSLNATSSNSTSTSTTTSTTTTTTTPTTTTTTTTKPPKDEDNEIIAPSTTLPSLPEALSQQHSDRDRPSPQGKTAFLQPTESAAILAGVFVAIALLGYVGLLLWRRVLEKRYGNREMLVNEDDDFDTSDMRHFEL